MPRAGLSAPDRMMTSSRPTLPSIRATAGDHCSTWPVRLLASTPPSLPAVRVSAFAVPVNLAKGVIDQLEKHGEVTRGWLGVAIQNITEEIWRNTMVSPGGKGVLVAEVFEGDPADKAGIKPQDIILSVDGQEGGDQPGADRTGCRHRRRQDGQSQSAARGQGKNLQSGNFQTGG